MQLNFLQFGIFVIKNNLNNPTAFVALATSKKNFKLPSMVSKLQSN